MCGVKSAIVDDMGRCVVCDSPYVQIHHVFFGANRKKSDKYNYVVPLCAKHHTGSDGVHFNKELDLQLKRRAEEHYIEHHGSKEDFIKTFGKNYL